MTRPAEKRVPAHLSQNLEDRMAILEWARESKAPSPSYLGPSLAIQILETGRRNAKVFHCQSLQLPGYPDLPGVGDRTRLNISHRLKCDAARPEAGRFGEREGGKGFESSFGIKFSNLLGE